MNAFESALAGLLSLPVAKDDRNDPRKYSQYVAIATEVAKLKPPRGVETREWRALVEAIGGAETHYLLRVMEGHCKPFECDRGHARSSWQLHKNLYTAPVWEQLQGFTTIAVQVQTADAMMKRAYYQCERSNPEGDWVRQVVLSFAGKGCKPDTIVPWRGLDLRINYWNHVRRAMG